MTSIIRWTLNAVVAIAAIGSGLAAQTPSPTVQLAITRVKSAAPVVDTITLTSPTISPNGAIPLAHSDYGQRVSPALKWTGVPGEAKSLVLLMEDPDANSPKPFIHWVLYNVPPKTEGLPESMAHTPRLDTLGGALQGRTSKGSVGYFGPRPPTSDPAHHYHFQLFALDVMLALEPEAEREAVLAAMSGHVLAAGELVGTFKAPAGGR